MPADAVVGGGVRRPPAGQSAHLGDAAPRGGQPAEECGAEVAAGTGDGDGRALEMAEEGIGHARRATRAAGQQPDLAPGAARFRRMIRGAHVILYSNDAEADRAFLQDLLGLGHVDAGGGWLILQLPPAEVAVHPAESSGAVELYLVCDDVDATVAELGARGVTLHRAGERPGVGAADRHPAARRRDRRALRGASPHRVRPLSRRSGSAVAPEGRRAEAALAAALLELDEDRVARVSPMFSPVVLLGRDPAVVPAVHLHVALHARPSAAAGGTS